MEEFRSRSYGNGKAIGFGGIGGGCLPERCNFLGNALLCKQEGNLPQNGKWPLTAWKERGNEYHGSFL
jgi:hypothetical protein